MVFENRQEAGSLLAEELVQYKEKDAIVLALPRGGVPVGYEIAKTLHTDFAAFPVRKVGAPFNQEYAVGAIAPGDITIIDEEPVDYYKISKDQIDKVIQEEKKELARRKKTYGTWGDVYNKIVIIVDDGVATGLTVQAAIASLKQEKPRKIILAIPCSPIETAEKLEKLVDEFICLDRREDFTSVGACYREFDQVTDEEVLNILQKK